MNAQTQIAHAHQSVGLLNLESFELSQRIAKMLSSSTLVPEQYRATIQKKAGKDEYGNQVWREEVNPNGLSNCVIALNMANRMGADPLMVMQNLYLVNGRPSWSSQFIMAGINSSGRFSALRFEIKDLGEKEIGYEETTWENRKPKKITKSIKVHDFSCVAWAIERETGERLESSTITIEMAVKEGWYQKDGSKWQTMPEQMLRYRAASFFGRVYAPELLMGLRSTEEEQERIIDVTPAAEQGTTTTTNPFNFQQLKRDILTAKSPDQLQKLEIFIEEHSNESERKELIKLMQARINKLTAVTEETETQESASQVEASDSIAAVTEKLKTEPKKARASAKKNEVNTVDEKYQTLLDSLLLRVLDANSPVEARAQLRYADNNKWTDEQRQPLEDAIEKRIAELNTDQPSSVQKPLLKRIEEAQSIDELHELLKEARRMTGKEGHLVMVAWSARKEVLSRQDIFTTSHQDPSIVDAELSYVDAVILRINSAKNQDDINAEYADPAIEELSDADRKLIDDAASKRESELFGN